MVGLLSNSDSDIADPVNRVELVLLVCNASADVVTPSATTPRRFFIGNPSWGVNAVGSVTAWQLDVVAGNRVYCVLVSCGSNATTTDECPEPTVSGSATKVGSRTYTFDESKRILDMA